MNIETGTWDPVSRTFTPSTDLSISTRSTIAKQRHPYFFARVLGDTDFDVTAEAIAICQPRDIVLVLDYSASMNDDSELRSIGVLGQAAVEANLLRIYEELESPRFGNMQLEPVDISGNSNSTVKTQLGLNGVPYPFPSGSWTTISTMSAATAMSITPATAIATDT